MDCNQATNGPTMIKRCVVAFGLWLIWSFAAEAEDVYSLFGKLFLSGRVEYDFTNTRDFLADVEAESVRQDEFDFDRVFRRGFHSVMVIEETAGNVKNILSLGEVPTTFTKFTFDQIDLDGVRWDVRSERTDWTFLMVPGSLNPALHNLTVTVDKLHIFYRRIALDESLKSGVSTAGHRERLRHVEFDDVDAHRAGEFDASIRRTGIDIDDLLRLPGQRAKTTFQPLTFIAADNNHADLRCVGLRHWLVISRARRRIQAAYL